MNKKTRPQKPSVDESGQLRQRSRGRKGKKTRRLAETPMPRGMVSDKRDSNRSYKMVFENANDGIIIHDTEGRIFDINPTMYRRLGYTKQEMLSMTLKDLVTPEFAKKIKERTDKLESEGVAIFESADRRKDGTAMPVEVSARYIDFDGRKLIMSIVRDISDRKLAESLIASTLKDKEILLSELNYRVKNNLQTVSSLLSHHYRRIRDEETKEIVAAIQEWIQALLFIQEKLYRHKNYQKIDVSVITQSLVARLSSLDRIGVERVQIIQDVKGVSLNIHQAISCGMIMYELVSNAMEHAFPEGRSGTILIQMRRRGRGRFELIISDNGVGFPQELDFRRAGTFGLKHVKDLVKDLAGTISLAKKAGTTFKISF